MVKSLHVIIILSTKHIVNKNANNKILVVAVVLDQSTVEYHCEFAIVMPLLEV